MRTAVLLALALAIGLTFGFWAPAQTQPAKTSPDAQAAKPDSTEAHNDLGVAPADKGPAVTQQSLPAGPAPSSQTAEKSANPLNEVQVMALLCAQISPRRIQMLVEERGIAFQATPDFLKMAQEIGRTDKNLLNALEHATLHETPVDSETASKLARAKQNLLLSAELAKKNELAQAETEARAALGLFKQYPELYLYLAAILAGQKKFDDAIAELHEALRLEPSFPEAHSELGSILGAKGDKAAGLAELREAARLRPTYFGSHTNLAEALAKDSQMDAAMAEAREAISVGPSEPYPHIVLGRLLAKKGDMDGAVTELREAVKLGPDDAEAHFTWAELLL